jgi:hypothetical protein
LVCLWPWLPEADAEGEVMDIDDVEEALECEWWW